MTHYIRRARPDSMLISDPIKLYCHLTRNEPEFKIPNERYDPRCRGWYASAFKTYPSISVSGLYKDAFIGNTMVTLSKKVTILKGTKFESNAVIGKDLILSWDSFAMSARILPSKVDHFVVVLKSSELMFHSK